MSILLTSDKLLFAFGSTQAFVAEHPNCFSCFTRTCWIFDVYLPLSTNPFRYSCSARVQFCTGFTFCRLPLLAVYRTCVFIAPTLCGKLRNEYAAVTLCSQNPCWIYLGSCFYDLERDRSDLVPADVYGVGGVGGFRGGKPHFKFVCIALMLVKKDNCDCLCI